MRAWLLRILNAAAALAGSCVFMLFVLMLYAGIGRKLNWNVSGVNDVVAWLCASASFFGMAHAFKNGDFVRVTLLLDRLAPAPRRMLEASCLSLATVAVGYLAFWATAFAFESYEFNEQATGLVVIPIWIPQTTFVLGSWLLVLAVLDELWLVLRGEKPSYQLAMESRHAKGDFSADL